MTTRDKEILEILTHKLRVLSAEQIARAWWDDVETSARRRLASLAEQGWITTFNAIAQPPPSMLSPLSKWESGGETPNFGSLSHKLRERWSVPAKRTAVVVATARGGAAFGGWGGRIPRMTELAHDIALAEVFLLFRRDAPGRAKGWRSEASLYAEGFGRDDNLPDAMIVSRKEKLLIELGGSYPKKRLLEFHESCVGRDLGYEIW